MAWIAFTLLGVSLIAHASDVVKQRSYTQEAADSVALAYVISGATTAHQLARILHVTVMSEELSHGVASVVVSSGGYSATSSATSSSRG